VQGLRIPLFSEGHPGFKPASHGKTFTKNSDWHLKARSSVSCNRQVGVPLARGAKNLDAAEKQRQAAGTSPETTPETKADIKGIT